MTLSQAVWGLATALVVGVAAAGPARAQEPEDFQRQAGVFAKFCARCHTVGKGDRVGPDLKDVTTRREPKWVRAFIAKPSAYLDSDPTATALLEKFGGVRMEDLGLTAEQIEDVIAYIEAVSAGGGLAPDAELPVSVPRTAPGPDEGRGAAPVGLVCAGGVLLCALWALRRGWPTVAAVLLLVSVAGAYWAGGGRGHHRILGDQQGYAPVQPVAFSHALHAGEMQISCLYCHPGAAQSPVAGVPAVSTCIGCHRMVRQRSIQTAPSPEIAKVVAAWDSRTGDQPQTIPWVRVHRLPDFVHFSHEAHVRNGVDCQQCHGAVQTMERVRQAADLTMGWCVNCHRQRTAPAPTDWRNAEGPLDCAACHQ